MDLTRLRHGELLSGAAALALVVALFLDWNRAAEATSESGWSSLGIVMVLLVLVAISLALALVFTTITKRPAAIPIGAAVLTTGVGSVVTLVLAIRIVFLDDSLWGAYLGLLLSALVCAGSWWAMADERMDAPYSAAPDIPPRPAPTVEA